MLSEKATYKILYAELLPLVQTEIQYSVPVLQSRSLFFDVLGSILLPLVEVIGEPLRGY